MSRIFNFYMQFGKDSEHRWLEQIWKMSNDELLHSHDVIQWLFPTNEESAYNPNAPVLTKKDILLWHRVPKLQENLRTSYFRFLSLFNLTLKDDQLIEVEKHWVWNQLDHNWVRFTRILKSTKMLGLEKEAQMLYDFLKTKINQKEPSWKHWHEAMM